MPLQRQMAGQSKCVKFLQAVANTIKCKARTSWGTTTSLNAPIPKQICYCSPKAAAVQRMQILSVKEIKKVK